MNGRFVLETNFVCIRANLKRLGESQLASRFGRLNQWLYLPIVQFYGVPLSLTRI
jgi:hypothetical protein